MEEVELNGQEGTEEMDKEHGKARKEGQKEGGNRLRSFEWTGRK